jgi:hypothetical protein
MITQAQRKKAEEISDSFLSITGVDDSQTDEWNDYGEISILITLDFRMRATGSYLPKTGFNMRKVKDAIKKQINGYKGGIQITPKREYEGREFLGYDKDYIKLTIEIPKGETDDE